MVLKDSSCQHSNVVPVIIKLSKVTINGYEPGSEAIVILCLDCGQRRLVESEDKRDGVTE